MNNNTLTFEQLPSAIQKLMEDVKSLNEKVDMIAAKTGQDISHDPHRIISVEEVCRMIKKTRNTLYSMTSKGEIPSYKQGKYLYFFEDEIVDWIKQCRKSGSGVKAQSDKFFSRRS